MNDTFQGASIALQLFEPMSNDLYSIEAVVHITQTPRHQIAVYCRHGLITPVTDPERDGWWFDHEAIRMLRRIECLRIGVYGDKLNASHLRIDHALDGIRTTSTNSDYSDNRKTIRITRM